MHFIFCLLKFLYNAFIFWNGKTKMIRIYPSRWSSTQKQLAFFTNKIKMFVHSPKNVECSKNIGNHLNVYIFEVVVKLSTISAFTGPNGRNLSIEGKFKYLRFFLRLIVSGYRCLNYVLFIEIFFSAYLISVHT